MPKYGPLSDWLVRLDKDSIEVSFDTMDSLVGGLPRSARTYTAWWGNNHVHVQAQAWMDVGFQTEKLDIPHRHVTFKRLP